MTEQARTDGAPAAHDHLHEQVRHEQVRHEHDPHDHDHQHDHSHAGGLGGVIRSLFAPHSHDSADSIDTALESSAAGIRAVKVSLGALLATALAQLAVVLATGSVALLADTIHNFSDALTAVPLWIGFVLGRRGRTRRYTFGYGRAEDLAGLFILAMILASAIAAGWQSVSRLLDPQPIGHPWVVLVAGFIGFVGNELVAAYRMRVGRRIGSAALVADGLHARTDGFTSLAVVIGAVGVLLGLPLADPIVGLVITIMIVGVLRSAARNVFGRLMDGIDPDVVARVEAILQAAPGITAVQEVQLRWVGHRVRGEAVVLVDAVLDVAGAHRAVAQARAAVTGRVRHLEGLVIEVVPSRE